MFKKHKKYIKTPYNPYERREGREWIKGKNMCEVCGYKKATWNLKLDKGTHKMCVLCRDFN